jgi:hypothetical protein
MKGPIISKVEKDAGIPELARILSDRLSGASVNSLLLEVYSRKAAKMTPAMLLEQYRTNRLVQPSSLDMIGLLETELQTLRFFEKWGFLPLELSPVAALGSCSAVAKVSQNKVLTALRNSELVADATNCLALHIAAIKAAAKERGIEAAGKEKGVEAAGEKRGQVIRFCTVHRHVRTQSFADKRFLPHFKIGCMVTSGYDTGNYQFECEGLAEQFGVMHALLRDVYGIERFRLVVKRRGGDDEQNPAIEKVYPFLAERLDGVEVGREEPEGRNDYYKGVQCKLYIEAGGREWEIADGGPVDWTQQLLSNRKERLLASGFGLELLYKIQNGWL